MNPAFRIWAWAIAICTIVCFWNGQGFMIIILLIVAVASVVSLLGFYVLYELLRHLQLAPISAWTCAILGTSFIVAFNAMCLLFFIEDNGSIQEMWSLFCDAFPFAAIPMMAALVGTAISYKKINAFCTRPSEAYYPDACI